MSPWEWQYTSIIKWHVAEFLWPLSRECKADNSEVKHLFILNVCLFVSLSPSIQIRWEKNITLGEPPGFLHSWWWWVFFCYISPHHWQCFKKRYFPCLFSLIWLIVLKAWFSGCILLNIALWAPVILHDSSPRLLLSACCSVFWDLYCAAPERRDTCEHSSEAKAFHDYVSLWWDSLPLVTDCSLWAEMLHPIMSL